MTNSLPLQNLRPNITISYVPTLLNYVVIFHQIYVKTFAVYSTHAISCYLFRSHSTFPLLKVGSLS